MNFVQNFFGRQGRREVESLHQLYTPAFNQFKFILVLHTLGDNQIVQLLENVHNILVKCSDLWVAADPEEEGTVQFDDTERHLQYGVQVGISRTEVIQTQANSGIRECSDIIDERITGRTCGGFSDLKLNKVGINTMLMNDLNQTFSVALLSKLEGGEIKFNITECA